MFPQIYDCEGFFVARLRKTASVEALPAPGYKVGKFPFIPLHGKQAAEVKAAAKQSGIAWQDDQQLWLRDKEIWLFPKEIIPLFGQVRFSRIGLRLAEQYNKGYRWQHEAVIALVKGDSPLAFALTEFEADEWYHGRDIYPDESPSLNEVIVTYQGQPLGLARKVGSRLKNSYPRDLVRDGKLFAHKG
ncbi:Ribosomal RNA small subunit methyltransferase F [compost metagenome]